MKKRIFASIAAVVLAVLAGLSVPSTAYAVSRTTTTEITGVGLNADDAANGQVLGARRGSIVSSGVTMTTITDGNILDSLSDLELFAKLISEYTKKQVKASELSILDSMDIKPDEGVIASVLQPLFVAFSFPGIAANTEAWVLHFGTNGWEVIPATVSEGKIVGEFTELSPVALVAKTSTLKGSVLGSNRAVSPRTGDNRAVVMLLSGAAICLIGVVSKKKLFS